MIQVGTSLKIIDNSGAKKVLCLKVYNGYKRRYAVVGDVILISVKTLRKRRRFSSKVKKGGMHKALIVRTRSSLKTHSCDLTHFTDNAAVLITLKNKLVGTRIFGSLPKVLRFTKFLRLVSVSAGFVC
jgi:large subunit ribosomal protein L14